MSQPVPPIDRLLAVLDDPKALARLGHAFGTGLVRAQEDAEERVAASIPKPESVQALGALMECVKDWAREAAQRTRTSREQALLDAVRAHLVAEREEGEDG